MDIVRDIIDRLATALRQEGGFSDSLFEEVEQQIRADWGGDRPYIPKAGESERRALSARNAAILRDWRNGERVPLIARKHGISRARAWTIIREEMPG